MKFLGYYIIDPSGEVPKYVGYTRVYHPFAVSWARGIAIMSISNDGYLLIHTHWIKVLQRRFRRYLKRTNTNDKVISHLRELLSIRLK